MENCIFCKIVRGEMPAEKTYEDEKFVAFLDLHPKGPQHTLLIPKEHYEWVWEVPGELYSELFLTAKKIALDLKERTKADYVQLSVVGKDVPHAHLHLIPRFLADKE
jgi:histidine triad (HIT) family protein